MAIFTGSERDEDEFDVDLETKRLLVHCFRFDHLSTEQGIAFLIGILPDDDLVNAVSNPNGCGENDFAKTNIGSFPLLNGKILNDRWEFSALNGDYLFLLQYWNSGKHPELTPPLYFIEWALSKNFRPDWLDRAIEFGLYKPKQETGAGRIALTDNSNSLTFDKTSIMYPPELDIALQAWLAVSATEGKGKPKARIKEWLDANTSLSNEAKERIATVANWDKMGGATRSD